MRDTDAAATFQSLVKQYEASGWVIRTINEQALRATAKSTSPHAAVNSGGVAVATTVTATAPVCRKLWIDSQGEAQETNVPC